MMGDEPRGSPKVKVQNPPHTHSHTHIHIAHSLQLIGARRSDIVKHTLPVSRSHTHYTDLLQLLRACRSDIVKHLDAVQREVNGAALKRSRLVSGLYVCVCV